MPHGMQEIGTQLHWLASRFAVEAQSASVSNDLRPALAALGTVMQQCVACQATIAFIDPAAALAGSVLAVGYASWRGFERIEAAYNPWTGAALSLTVATP